MNASGDTREETFRGLYAAHFDCVLGYALRRTSRAEDAADVTAETFLVAWRRLQHVPVGDAARPWLYAVARRQLANQRRGELRRRRLGERLRHDLAVVVPDVSDQVVQDHTVDAAMARLSARDEEVLQLHLWEGLEPREIGEVLGLSGTVVRPRLSRARARLRELLGNDPPAAGHIQDKHPTPSREEER
ncbi:RNA polymerase sigma factor [Nocardioides baculatus]|uniref:Sigma-70 family RNA polymerase sigma factor n=1 Tax=Nocardioides baculatus TaxID=2801337 RepID=A0ABS1L5Y1_9ACTN|nr:sigma-70 family RNA polymerase sigma factor [Nocardioides baculatus]MBL0747020.1 sigma-70 family RNA polymerase sigma factor [Nocardioides baculatus]